MQEIEEEWRDIPGYEGYYQVSNLGRVRSLDRVVNGHGRGFPRLHKSRIIAQSYNHYGYRTISLCMDSKPKTHLVHRLVANAFISNCENKEDVNHINGMKTDNAVTNLEWATRKENMQHAYSNGLVGHHNPSNKKRVRISLPNGFGKEFECIEYAAKYIGVCASGVSRACPGIRPHAGGYQCEFI